MTSALRLAIVITIAVAAAPSAAIAGDKDAAKTHVANAVRAHKAGRFAEARVELEAAYALDPQPDLLYAMGQVLSKLGDCAAATTWFERFAASQNDPAVTTVVEQAIAACSPAAPAPEPVRPRSAAPAPPPPRATAVRPPSPWYRDRLGGALVVSGVTAAAIGAVLYRGAVADLDAAEDTAVTTSLERYQELVDRAHARRAAAIGFAGAGAALITAGILRYLLRDASGAAPEIAAVPARGGGLISYERRF